MVKLALLLKEYDITIILVSFVWHPEMFPLLRQLLWALLYYNNIGKAVLCELVRRTFSDN